MPNEPLNFDNISWDEIQNRALIQGAGTNQDGQISGINGTLLEAQVEPIRNEDCDTWISNSTSRQFARLVARHLPNNLSKAIVCALPVEDSVRC